MIIFDNFDDLQYLRTCYDFTFMITGDCPDQHDLCKDSNCNQDDCIYCWRNALKKAIDKKSEEN